MSGIDIGIGGGVLLLVILAFFGIRRLFRNYSAEQKEEGMQEVEETVLRSEVERYRRNEGIDAAPMDADAASDVARKLARRMRERKAD